MEDNTDIDESPLIKQKTTRSYEKTPAREECIKKMIEARKKNIEMKKAQRLLEAKQTMEKYKMTDQPVVEKPKPRKVIEEEEEEEDDEPIVIIRKKPKKKKQPKIIIEEESEDDEEEEPQIIKKKKTPVPVEKKTSILKVKEEPKAQVAEQKPVDYRSFFA